MITKIPLGDGVKKALSVDDFVNREFEETGESRALGADTTTTDKVLYPYNIEALKALRYSSVYHSKALKAVAVDVALSGHTIKTDNDTNRELLQLFFNTYQFDATISRVVEDYRQYGFAAFEVAYNKRDNLLNFKHVRSNSLTMCSGGSKAVQTVGANTVYFKVLGGSESGRLDYKTGVWDENTPDELLASSIVWVSDGGPDSDYYEEPCYLGSILTILSDEYLREYNNNGFVTNGIPNYFITISGPIDDTTKDENGRTFKQRLESEVLDLQNKPGTAILVTFPTQNPDDRIDINVTRVSDEKKEASFEQFREGNMYEILAAHEVPPQRLGINVSGPLAGSIAIEVNRTYNDKTVRPIQRKIETLLNEYVIKGILGISDSTIEYNGLTIRNIEEELKIIGEMFKDGAIKPVEIREFLGRILGLKTEENFITLYPETNEIYINGQAPGELNEPTSLEDGVMKSIDDKIVEFVQKWKVSES